MTSASRIGSARLAGGASDAAPIAATCSAPAIASGGNLRTAAA
jgi:hypothetical protein